MSTPLNMLITAAGRAAAILEDSTGFQLKVTHVGFSTVGYVNDAADLSIPGEVARVPIAYGTDITPTQIRIQTVWREGTTSYTIKTVALYAGSTLFATFSVGPAGDPYFIKSPGIDFVFYYDMNLDTVPPGSVTVLGDSGQAAVLEHLATHLNEENPHAQYVLRDEFEQRDQKDHCRFTTTGNIDLEDLGTQAGGDWGVALDPDDPILVKNQSDQTENGVYLAKNGPWVRRADADEDSDFSPGMVIPVAEGSSNYNDSLWQLSTDGTITIGATNINFVRTGAGFYAPTFSPALAGLPTTPTPSTSDASTQIANTEFTKNAIAARIGSDGSAGHRNKLLNPWMEIDQRLSGSALVLTNTPAYGLDRWFGTATAANWTMQRVTTSDGDAPNALRLQRANAAATTGVVRASQIIESVDVCDMVGKAVTVSAYIKAGANFSGVSMSFELISGTVADEGAASLHAGTWTGQAQLANPTFVPTGTRQRISFSGTVPSNAKELGLRVGYTGVGTAGAADYVDITGVQVEIGSDAGLPERRPMSRELALCKRYFERMGGRNGVSSNTTNPVVVTGYWETRKRVAPTLSYSDGTTANRVNGYTPAGLEDSGTTPTAITLNNGPFGGVEATKFFCASITYNLGSYAGFSILVAADAEL